MTSPMAPNGASLCNYAPAPLSPAIDYIPSNASTYAAAPGLDFFGNQRKTAANPIVDAGAVEVQGLAHPVLSSISPTSGFRGNNSNVTLTGTGLTGTTSINGAAGITITAITVVDDAHVTATFAIAANALLERGTSVSRHRTALPTPCRSVCRIHRLRLSPRSARIRAFVEGALA